MRGIKFPNMFSGNATRVWKDTEYHETTLQNAELVLLSERGELTCDPYFGVLLKHYMFEQNTSKLADVIIDIIYTQLSIFLPQIKVSRSDIEILQDQEKGKLYCKFTGVCQIDYQLSTYQLLLFDSNENSN